VAQFVLGELLEVGMAKSSAMPDGNPLTDPYTQACFVAAALKMAAWWQSRRKRLHRLPA